MEETETVRRTILTLGKFSAYIMKKANEYGEFVVTFRVNGVAKHDADYFGSDYDDALGTAKACLLFMEKHES